jgi:polysaccharide biosynthesis protein PslH
LDYVNLLGFVDNLSDIVSNCKLALMPVVFGTGIKTKVLDAMSFGLPVITNDVGSEGVSLQDGKHCIIRNDAHGIADAVIELYNNDNLHRNISSNAMIYIALEHNSQLLRDKYLSCFKGIEDK